MSSSLYDVELLQPYYDFITKIRGILDECLVELGIDSDYSGFIGWPIPNPYRNSTESGIYLEFCRYVLIEHLRTPFGEVKLLGTGLLSNLKAISELFMTKILHICNLDRSVKLYRLSPKGSDNCFSDKFVKSHLNYRLAVEAFNKVSGGTNKF